MEVRREFDFKVIGSNLKKLRKSRNLSVEQVRCYMQLSSVQAIYKWERGESLPQADTLLALMQLYGVNRIDVITEESPGLSSFSFSSALTDIKKESA